MTYRELRDKMSTLSEERLDDNIVVWDPYVGEFIDVDKCIKAHEEPDCADTLHLFEQGHLYFVLKDF